MPKAKKLTIKASQKQAEIKASNLQWVKILIEFFELTQMVGIEQESALRIENFFCNIRRMRVKRRIL